ncbi:hypothetical protein CN234_16815 [Sinorhizobium meliloti]|uniref:hypothetical protein n=1 Tax=Rhizobium meliloti TaxID=382 RepID=UPI000FD9A753|nr:hypothetical protein [Sinorhizobium meliloti]RVG08814.1 hypothetical protein CN234_16815 [Sinorhizobium meliloti]
MQAKERLFLNADKTKLVKDGDKHAAFLYAVPGDEIPESAASKFGLVDGRLKGSDKAVAAEPRKQAEGEAGLKTEKETKAAAANKEAKAGAANKEAKGGETKEAK